MLKDLVIANRSCRGYDRSRIFTKEELLELIDCARLTASSINQQPLKYRPVWEAEKVAGVQKLTKWAAALKDVRIPHEGMEPTAFIIICQDTEINPNMQTFLKDVGIAAQTMLLAAVENGDAGCMIGNFNPKLLQSELGLTDSIVPLLVVALGKPAEKIVLTEVGEGQGTAYYRDENDVHYVPKRRLEDVVI